MIFLSKIFSITVSPNPPPDIKQRASNINSGVMWSSFLNVAMYASIITLTNVNTADTLLLESSPFELNIS